MRRRGRLLLPMTTQRAPARCCSLFAAPKSEFAPHFLCRAGFVDCEGARDPEAGRELRAALIRDGARAYVRCTATSRQGGDMLAARHRLPVALGRRPRCRTTMIAAKPSALASFTSYR
jgi:hypothetical protein